MANRSKDQGTKFETEIVNLLQSKRIKASRIAEGGTNDIGDVMIRQYDIVIEAKDRANLNVHETLVKAQGKSEGRFTVLFWKRRVRKGGNTNRTQAGPPVVVMSVDDFVELLDHVDAYEWAESQMPRTAHLYD